MGAGRPWADHASRAGRGRGSLVRFVVERLQDCERLLLGDVLADPLFAKTFLFHPRDARTEVLNLVDDSLMAGAGRDEIMGKLSQLYLRWHRHGHLNAGRIYKGALTGDTAGPVVT